MGKGNNYLLVRSKLVRLNKTCCLDGKGNKFSLVKQTWELGVQKI